MQGDYRQIYVLWESVTGKIKIVNTTLVIAKGKRKKTTTNGQVRCSV